MKPISFRYYEIGIGQQSGTAPAVVMKNPETRQTGERFTRNHHHDSVLKMQ